MSTWAGDEEAEYWNQIGNEYLFGINKTRDYSKAEKYYEKAAHLGSNNAQYNLAILIRYGKTNKTPETSDIIFSHLREKGLLDEYDEPIQESSHLGTDIVSTEPCNEGGSFSSRIRPFVKDSAKERLKKIVLIRYIAEKYLQIALKLEKRSIEDLEEIIDNSHEILEDKKNQIHSALDKCREHHNKNLSLEYMIIIAQADGLLTQKESETFHQIRIKCNNIHPKLDYDIAEDKKMDVCIEEYMKFLDQNKFKIFES